MKGIIENNRLIAKFLGYEYLGWNDRRHRTGDMTSGYWGHKDAIAHALKIPNSMMFNPLTFHCSWDQLMRVVTKIEKIQLPSPAMIPVRVEISGNYCRIFQGTWNENNEGFISYVSYDGNKEQYTKIEATYLAVVEFIKWYNKQNENASKPV